MQLTKTQPRRQMQGKQGGYPPCNHQCHSRGRPDVTYLLRSITIGTYLLTRFIDGGRGDRQYRAAPPYTPVHVSVVGL